MKTGLIVALVLCLAAAAFFDPVKAQEQEGTEQSGEDERLFSGKVEPLTRDLQGVEGANDADAEATEATGTDLEQDPSEGMMRDLKTHYKYGPKTGYYRPHSKTGHYRPHSKTGHYRPHSKTGHYYPKPGYSKAGHGRRLSNYGGYYSLGHKGSHYKGRRLSGYGGYGRGYGGYYRKSYGHYGVGL